MKKTATEVAEKRYPLSKELGADNRIQEAARFAFVAGAEWLKRQDGWISVNDSTPIASESGIWDGLRSDLVIGMWDDGACTIARVYEGVLDGNKFIEWYDDDNEFELLPPAYWHEFPFKNKK